MSSKSIQIGVWVVCLGCLVPANVFLAGEERGERNASSRFANEFSGKAHPLHSAADLEPLVRRAAGTRLVLLGEASHGTREFYRWRTFLSRRLVAGEGFTFVAVEGDWVSMERLDRYVRHQSEAESAREVLLGFERWPLWMWANQEMIELAEWLRGYNRFLPAEDRVGIYGIDLYGFGASLEEVVAFFRRVDPEQASRVEELYGGLSRFGGDGRGYARALQRGALQTQEEEVGRVLEKVRRLADEGAGGADDTLFRAEQNARVVKNAESHFRALVEGGVAPWNRRVDHMQETLVRLGERYGERGGGIVWAHNTHIGDARATPMAGQGMRNIGQLTREKYGPESVFLVGFGTARGEVMAARQWEGRPEVFPVPDPPGGSLEAVLDEMEPDDFLLLFDDIHRTAPWQEVLLGHRAFGVVYDPDAGTGGGLVPTLPTFRYNAFLFFAETSPVRPLHPVE